MNTHYLHVKGFTLIETLVAIAIVAIAVAGPLYTAGQAFVVAKNASNQVIASYLAQEGIEYVRMMRDDEYLTASAAGLGNISQTAWNNFTTGENNSSNPASISKCISSTCALDPLEGPMGTGGGDALKICSRSANTCNYLRLMSNGIYTTQNLPGSTKTPFIRTIQATTLSSTEELITSTVTWSYENILYSVTVTDNLTSWE